ncbi:MAG: isoprenyl transferase [Flavobacterium sp.]|jgi:undecaprenyl diphosphate synthase
MMPATDPLINQINLEKVPKHIAIIMDGNGRWAKQQGMIRAFGHQNGTKTVNQIVEACSDINVTHLTLYAFSTENWNRPKYEVDALMTIMVNSLKKELPTMMAKDVQVTAIGNIEKLPSNVRKVINEVIETTKNNKKIRLSLALSYGSREELTTAIKEIASKVKNNIISTDNIDASVINQHLYTHDMPDVDLLIRTSGEHRISNFLLWQIAYAELYFCDVLWPDFTPEHLFEAVINYQNRERRFGKTSEQIK